MLDEQPYYNELLYHIIVPSSEGHYYNEILYHLWQLQTLNPKPLSPLPLKEHMWDILGALIHLGEVEFVETGPSEDAARLGKF